MIILPAIDVIGGEAVRLLRGDYGKKTVYSGNPVKIALDFKEKGAENIHIVDLEGAKNGGTPNFEVIAAIIAASGLSAEVGGGIRDRKTIEKYLNAGVRSVILGTAATNSDFVRGAVRDFGERIAVGIDIREGCIAVKGWTEKTDLPARDFLARMEEIGVKTAICTDISRDGAMRGTNLALYEALTRESGMRIIASGGVSSMEDVLSLKKAGVYGAIIGKAYYIGAIDIKEAIGAAK